MNSSHSSQANFPLSAPRISFPFFAKNFENTPAHPPPPSPLNSKRTFHYKYNYSSPLLAKRDLQICGYSRPVDAIQARRNLRLSLYKMVSRGATQQSFIRRGSVRRMSNPLPFHIPFLAERVPCTSFVHILYLKMVPLSFP